MSVHMRCGLKTQMADVPSPFITGWIVHFARTSRKGRELAHGRSGDEVISFVKTPKECVTAFVMAGVERPRGIETLARALRRRRRLPFCLIPTVEIRLPGTAERTTFAIVRLTASTRARCLRERFAEVRFVMMDLYGIPGIHSWDCSSPTPLRVPVQSLGIPKHIFPDGMCFLASTFSEIGGAPRAQRFWAV
jgi:hypothetical protein